MTENTKNTQHQLQYDCMTPDKNLSQQLHVLHAPCGATFYFASVSSVIELNEERPVYPIGSNLYLCFPT